MPRFFFETYNGDLSADHEGTVLHDAHAARSIADERLFVAAYSEVTQGRVPSVIITVRDEKAEPIYRASLSMQGTWINEPKD